ncbi:hypothetical protein [Flagellimonas sp. CMM7]|uniref:hypothetical protein n=1 Tax=Flagellimonas sp. CMM7 TaxID=2654676 RepID=UPI0013CF5744|nr:hypothetical protein [Flagellimonas sp. CMM7]UII80009.1 hypothetical protein LV704_00460 [Flagellimonas sp. CMM7]
MNGYYKITEKIEELLLADPDVNTVTKGNANEIDSYKTTMFPLAHVAIEPGRFTTNTITLIFAITTLNQRETYNEPTLDKFKKNDNEDDNMNAMLYVLVRFYLQLKKFGDDFEVVNDPNPIPKLYQFKNLLDGWECSFEIEIPIEEVTGC